MKRLSDAFSDAGIRNHIPLITESLGLEKISETIESKLWSMPSSSPAQSTECHIQEFLDTSRNGQCQLTFSFLNLPFIPLLWLPTKRTEKSHAISDQNPALSKANKKGEERRGEERRGEERRGEERRGEERRGEERRGEERRGEERRGEEEEERRGEERRGEEEEGEERRGEERRGEERRGEERREERRGEERREISAHPHSLHKETFNMSGEHQVKFNMLTKSWF
ncbi:hypothetical protein DUI87_13344 [Hirundo rustica rustica]|uniref:Uncharacterized protein n=1 Tax=Hirundo rustica rustica TaxID=333673 RepID=A0A3M0KBG9_HIRRU|nr:hypothetical protein DUI87_13344 [Hirundo rustica rustica]